MSQNPLLAVGAMGVGLFFIFLMIKNILFVKNLKESEKNKRDS